MKWGAPTWFMLHTFAEKIKPEHFNEMRDQLLQYIKSICINVPCPYCAEHATAYLNKTNFNTITSKEDLQLYLFKFHNEVNIRKKNPVFTWDQSTILYKSAKIINIFNNFIHHFKNKHHSLRMIADDMYRERISIVIKEWFELNLNKFEIL
jgi:hypothetical protein